LKRLMAIVFGAVLVALSGCAAKVDPAFYTDIKALRPEGSGISNYGLATDCRPGNCVAAQRSYHAQFLAINAKYRDPVSPLALNNLFPFAEAVAGRIDANEISVPAGEVMIQDMRVRVNQELNKLRAMQAQADAARWSAFWQSQALQQQTLNLMRPIQCTTMMAGQLATTTCH
jgi:hypothetical protein